MPSDRRPDRQRADDALAVGEARFRFLADHLPQVVWAATRDGENDFLNRRWREITGGAEGVVGTAAWLPHTHPDDLGPMLATWQEAFEAGRPFQAEYRLRDADTGAWRWQLGRAVPVRDLDGQIVRWLGTCTDIDDLKRIQSELQASQAHLAAIFEQATAGFCELGLDGRFLMVNDALCRFLGRPRDELLGLGVADVTFPEDLPITLALFARAIDPGEPFVVEKRYARPDGTTVWASSSVARLTGSDGRVRAALAVVVDISERKRVEAAQARLNEDLERRVADAVAQRMRAEEALRQGFKMEALGQLVGGVAHDFNNASAVVLAGVALIAKRHGAALEAAGPGAARLLAGLRDGAERGASISRRLLAFARREVLRAEIIDPADLLGGLREVLANSLGPGIRVRVEAPAAGLPPLRADRHGLETALINLATNARDAFAPGGNGEVVLGAAAEATTVAAAGCRSDPTDLAPGRYVRLWVSDNGRGMDAETLARATEPFFTTKARDRGSGLGLSMADGFAAQSGGALRVESVPGQGTTVTLWLPRVMLDEEEPAPGRPRILVVDDVPVMRRYLCHCLRQLGWDATEAGNAAEALALLDAGDSFNALISDFDMSPAMDGVALIREARIRRPGLPAVLVSGSSAPAGLAALAAHEGFGVLRKPVSPAELAECLATLVARAHARTSQA